MKKEMIEKDIEYIASIIIGFIDEYCEPMKYDIISQEDIEALMIEPTNKILELTKDNRQLLYDNNYLHNIIEGYFEKDELWILSKEFLNDNYAEKYYEIMSDDTREISFKVIFSQERNAIINNFEDKLTEIINTIDV